MPGPPPALHPHVPVCQNMLHSPDIPRPTHPHLTTTVSSHFFHMERATFRVPVSTLQRNKTEGGWGLVDEATKCRALLLVRMYPQGTREVRPQHLGSRHGNYTEPWQNPPHVTRYPIKVAYVRAYTTDMAYVKPRGHDESSKHFRRRLYNTLRTMALAASTTSEIRVITMHPTLNWPQIWQNLHKAWVPDDVKSAWFLAIHEIIPTKKRPFKIHLADTNRCK